jgi:NIPSNAP
MLVEVRTSLARDQQWRALAEQLHQMIDHMENRILTPTAFSPSPMSSGSP